MDVKVTSCHVKVTAKVVVNVIFIVIFAALFTTSPMDLSLKWDNYQCKIIKKNFFDKKVDEKIDKKFDKKFDEKLTRKLIKSLTRSWRQSWQESWQKSWQDSWRESWRESWQEIFWYSRLSSSLLKIIKAYYLIKLFHCLHRCCHHSQHFSYYRQRFTTLMIDLSLTRAKR